MCRHQFKSISKSKKGPTKDLSEFDFDKVADHVEITFTKINKQFESIGKQFESIGKQFESIGKQFESMGKQFESIGKQLNSVINDERKRAMFTENPSLTIIKILSVTDKFRYTF